MEELRGYEEYLGRLPVSNHTRRNYLLRVRHFLKWLAGTPDGARALTDVVERNYCLQDYKVWLLQRGSSANTVNGSLSAVDNYFIFKGMGPARIQRADLPAVCPRSLTLEEQRRLLKQLERVGLRDRAVALIMMYCGLRISEVAALNISDVVLSARLKAVVVRCGKNNKRRVVPLNVDVAEVLQAYLPAQTSAEDPLFVSRRGNRLSVPAIDHLIRKLGKETGVDLSAHALRHTCITKLVRSGTDLVVVAELAGHSRLETTRRYSLPTEDDKIAAVEKLRYGTTGK